GRPLPESRQGQNGRIAVPFGRVDIINLQQHVTVANAGFVGRTVRRDMRNQISAIETERSKNRPEPVVFVRQWRAFARTKISNSFPGIEDEVESFQRRQAQGCMVISSS